MTNPTPTLRKNGQTMVTYRTEHHASAYDLAETLVAHYARSGEVIKSAAAAWREIRALTVEDGDPRLTMHHGDVISEGRQNARWDGAEDEWDDAVDTIVETLIKMGFSPEDAGAARSFYAEEA